MVNWWAKLPVAAEVTNILSFNLLREVNFSKVERFIFIKNRRQCSEIVFESVYLEYAPFYDSETYIENKKIENKSYRTKENIDL